MTSAKPGTFFGGAQRLGPKASQRRTPLDQTRPRRSTYLGPTAPTLRKPGPVAEA